ncbi:MAG: CdaR family protein [Lacrimispora sp.]|uniref:CdaR family protein n=1 Tax=Lacrimispora sp. TaxID=2719234 RepID=UPI0039E668F7
MKEKLLNNLGLKVASLALAFAVWMAVVNISNPVIDDSQQVNVEVRNEEVLEASGLTYDIGKDVVTVSYQVRTRDRSLVRASDFHAYVDLKDYNVTGAIPVTVEINKDKENLVKSDAITARPMVIRVKTEELQRKIFDLSVSTIGKKADGYDIGMISLSPDSVTVEGPESAIGQINGMGVEIDVENKTADFNGSAVPIFYDANGNKLTDIGSKVSVNSEMIDFNVSVLKAKVLTLNFEVFGQVEKGYRFTGVESAVTSVPVVGTKSVLAPLSSLSIVSDKLSIEDATEDKVVELDLSQYLPPNTSMGDQYKNITVTLKVEPLTTRTFTLEPEDLAQKGASPDYEYSFDKTSVDVTIRGLTEDLDTLEVQDLKAVIDLTNQGPGTHTGILRLEVSEGFELASVTPFNVTVTGRSQEPGTEAPSGESSGAGEETQ